MLVGWIAICLVVSWILRRRPDVAAIIIFGLWTLVPTEAAEIITGIKFSTSSALNLHPAAYFTYTYLVIVLFVAKRASWQAMSTSPGVLVLLAWVAILAGVLTFLQFHTSSPRGYVGNFLAGILWFSLCILASKSSPRFPRWLLATVLSVAAANAVLSIVQTMIGEVWPYTHYLEAYQPDFSPAGNRTTGTTDHPLVLALMLAGSLPLVTALRKWLPFAVLTVLLYIGLLESGSRAGLLVGLAGFSASMLLSSRPNVKHLASYLLAVGAGVVLYLGPLGQNLANRFANDTASASDRLSAYSYLGSHLSNFVLSGGGFGSSFWLKNHQVIPSSFENGYAMLVFDIGLLGGAIYLAVQLNLLWFGWRKGAPRYLIWAALTAMGAAATFSSFAVTSACAVLVWAPIALVVITRSEEGRVTQPLSPGPPVGVMAPSLADSRPLGDAPGVTDGR